MHGATLGIIGFGEIGREVAHRARAFAMNIVYFQRRPLPPAFERDLGVAYLPFAELLAQSDYVLVQLPLNLATRGIIDRAALARMKPGAMLIDVARAELIDRAALLEALDDGRLGGLGLDVGYSEPADPGEPLLRYRGRNVILMPHTAVGGRENALHDVETLCLSLKRGITRTHDGVIRAALVAGGGRDAEPARVRPFGRRTDTSRRKYADGRARTRPNAPDRSSWRRPENAPHRRAACGHRGGSRGRSNFPRR